MFGFNVHPDLPALLVIVLMAGAIMLFVRWRAKKEYKDKGG
jgi:hypothetical protein